PYREHRLLHAGLFRTRAGHLTRSRGSVPLRFSSGIGWRRKLAGSGLMFAGRDSRWFMTTHGV
ncbi:MAG: hypothetical protein EB020_13310, partial [Proteobacteria bacterium]|nr:hypothetical protein [Pseudomonadota bacterium]